ncbi:MAG: hypothetical protein WDO70_09820 [Alphaproteobacteria bacterium]
MNSRKMPIQAFLTRCGTAVALSLVLSAVMAVPSSMPAKADRDRRQGDHHDHHDRGRHGGHDWNRGRNHGPTVVIRPGYPPYYTYYGYPSRPVYAPPVIYTNPTVIYTNPPVIYTAPYYAQRPAPSFFFSVD